MARLGERGPPVLEAKHADDPELSPMVADRVPRPVDETSPVSGEKPSLGPCMEVTERVDTIATRRGRSHPGR